MVDSTPRARGRLQGPRWRWPWASSPAAAAARRPPARKCHACKSCCRPPTAPTSARTVSRGRPGSSRLDQLDPDQLKEEAEKALGDEFADKRELTAFPTTNEKLELALKPKVTHLLVVAEFCETLGTAWYATYTVPSGVRDAQCSAAAKDEEPPLPCVYVAIEGSELVGGGMAPSGFAMEPFETVCASSARPMILIGKAQGKSNRVSAVVSGIGSAPNP